MAGIEKICELSGKYQGGRMYGWKHNHIQVCPEYRDYFRKFIKNSLADCCLVVFKPECDFDYYAEQFVREDNYMFYVNHPKLLGHVNGQYYNYCRGDNLRHVFNNIWELIGYRPYHIEYLNMGMYEFAQLEARENTHTDFCKPIQDAHPLVRIKHIMTHVFDKN